MDPDEIKIKLVCPNPFPRYAIVWNDLCWHGEGWTADRRKAMLYAKLKVVNTDWREVVKQHREELP